MSFDIKQNEITGDWEFDSRRDIAGAEGMGLVEQRIRRRLRVVRGSYIYDASGTLGSRLRSMLRMGIPAVSAGIEMLIREALSPMTDILVTDVIVNTFGDGTGVVLDPTSMQVKIAYQIDLSAQNVVSASVGQFETTVDIPV